MPERASPDHIVGDRYLTSPAAVAARPFGPVDALDTRGDRPAQVRLVFVPAAWGESELADAVARWCRIGCAEICGILDFGRHHDRWFLVVPPTLGLPVERWRQMRRPLNGDAARLTLAFGRLVERIHAAGFAPDAATLADFAVGPGPTPFLERPLLGPPRPGALPAPRGDGQRTLARLFGALVAPEHASPPVLADWYRTAAAGGFPSLGDCLDELERAGANAAEVDAAAGIPGLAALLEDGELLHAAPPPPRTPPPLIALLALVAALAAVAALAGALLGRGGDPAPAAAATVPAAAAPQRARPLASAPRPRASATRRRPRPQVRRHHPPPRRPRRSERAVARAPAAAPSPPVADAPAAARPSGAADPQPPAGAGSAPAPRPAPPGRPAPAPLPAPGGRPLPPPAAGGLPAPR